MRTVPGSVVLRPLLLAGGLLAVAAGPAAATSPAIQTDPPRDKTHTLHADPLGGVIGIVYTFGVGTNPPDGAYATVRISVDRAGCALTASFRDAAAGAATVPDAAVSAEAPTVVRIGGPAGGSQWSLGVGSASPADGCTGAQVRIELGTEATDRIVPYVRALDPVSEPTVVPVPDPAPGPKDPMRALSAVPRATTTSYRSAGRRSVLRLDRSLGVAGRTYRVRVTRGGRTHATGTLRGRTLRLTGVRGVARPSGTFTLRALAGLRGRQALASRNVLIVR